MSHLPAWLTVLLAVLAVARLTRLVTADVIAQPFRAWVIRTRLDGHPERDDDDKLITLVHCRWCTSIWVSAPVAVAVYLRPHSWWVVVPLLLLALSHASTLLAGLEDD